MRQSNALDYELTKNVMKKPPLGIMPRFIWIDARKSEIQSALDRYIESNMPIPLEWIEEYNELIRMLKD